MKAGVNHFKTMVAKRASNGFGATIMPIQARLSHDNSVRTLHEYITLRPQA